MRFKNFFIKIGTRCKKIKKKWILVVCVLLMFFLSAGFSFGRYAYREIKDYYFATKKFYFNSDKLTRDGKVYKIENWSGVGSYSIKINVNSYENNNLYSEEDVYYDISYSCSDSVTCSIMNNKSEGVVSADSNNDDFTIVLSVPTGDTFDTGDSVSVSVSVTSSFPYKKTLSADFVLVVGQYGLAYEIDDSSGSPIFNVRVTNTLDYYVIRDDFLNYEVGGQLDIDTYLGLEDVYKDKCASSIVTLSFDPRVVLLDMTSDIFLNNVGYEVTSISGYDYVKSVSFKIDALTSESIKFYKNDATKDYTYPIDNVSSIVEVSYDQKVSYEL